MSYVSIFAIGLHAFFAWALIEMFVNLCHKLKRRSYVLLHYAVIILAFGSVFTVYFRFFEGKEMVFAVTMTAMLFVLLYELVVFRYLYSGERWFLNWTDWIFPIFLAASVIYFIGSFS